MLQLSVLDAKEMIVTTRCEYKSLDIKTIGLIICNGRNCIFRQILCCIMDSILFFEHLNPVNRTNNFISFKK